MIELQCHSHFSLLDGASSPEALAERAAELGFTTLALTDRNGLYGAPHFAEACKRVGIQPILGAQVSVGEDSILLLCENQTGYSNLSQLLTEAFRDVEKGEASASFEQLARHREGLICLLGSKEGLLWKTGSEEHLRPYLPLFDCFLLLTDHAEEGDERKCRALAHLAEKFGLGIVPSHAPRYARREEGRVHSLLRCIAHRKPLRTAHRILPANHNRYLRPPPLSSGAEEIASRCHFELDFSSYRFPEFPLPRGETAASYLRTLCERRLEPGMRCRLEEELALIERLDLSGYFLIVWDLVDFARKKGIPAQGRGSAANSLVAYLLGITPVNPLEHSLFLGRFLHDGMGTVPDIDIDFAATRSDLPDREDVIQYVYEKYGADHVAMVCTFITFRTKSAIREVGMALELPKREIDRMSKLSDPTLGSPLFQELVAALKGIPRHLSIHVGGMVIASKPLSQLVPLEPARMEGRVVCQWDKEGIEQAGLIKVDILGLGMLSLLRDVSHLTGVPLDQIPDGDPEVYGMIGRAETVGVFQVESRAQMQSLPRTRPANLPELAIQVALIRPGPLQGNMVSPYIRRRQGREPVSYPHPSLEPILRETLGVILFQEQVLQVAVAVAGFSDADANLLRKSIQPLRKRFVDGAAARGIDGEAIFAQIEGFALYGFCKSHALSFAKIAYWSAWFKWHYPAAFAVALLNNQPMGFYSPEVIVEEAKRSGVPLLPVDIEKSGERAQLEEGAIRLGLGLVGEQMERLIRAGALDHEGPRRELLWRLWSRKSKAPRLPPQSDWEQLLDEYRIMGLTARAHPMAHLRPDLPDVTPASKLRPGPHWVAGLLITRQRPPTAKGFAFLTLEDETGLMNVVVPPDLFEQEKLTIKTGGLLAIWGQCSQLDGITNLRAARIQLLISPHRSASSTKMPQS